MSGPSLSSTLILGSLNFLGTCYSRLWRSPPRSVVWTGQSWRSSPSKWWAAGVRQKAQTGCLKDPIALVQSAGLESEECASMCAQERGEAERKLGPPHMAKENADSRTVPKTMPSSEADPNQQLSRGWPVIQFPILPCPRFPGAIPALVFAHAHPPHTPSCPPHPQIKPRKARSLCRSPKESHQGQSRQCSGRDYRCCPWQPASGFPGTQNHLKWYMNHCNSPANAQALFACGISSFPGSPMHTGVVYSSH